MDRRVRKFCAYFYFVGFDCFSIGLHICFSLPNVEIHLPFGFIRIGYHWEWEDDDKCLFGLLKGQG